MIYHLIITSFRALFFLTIYCLILSDLQSMRKQLTQNIKSRDERVVFEMHWILQTQLIVLGLKQCIWSCLELIIYTFHCNNFQFNYWALCYYAYVVIFHLYLTLMFIDEDGFCYFIPLNAFRDYLQQSTSPIFSSFMDLQALGRNFIRPSFSELVLVGMLSDGSSTLCYAQVGCLFA